MIKFKQVSIYDDGTGYKLATDIKEKILSENNNILAENIKITEYSWGYGMTNAI